MSRKILLTSVLVAGALFVAGCGGSASGSAADNDGDDGSGNGGGGVTIVATEFAFDPGDFSLAADTATDLTLDNQGVVEHDIVVEELGDQKLVHAGPGESVTESVTLASGTYTFYCSIPGHRQSGMEGTLTVE